MEIKDYIKIRKEFKHDVFNFLYNYMRLQGISCHPIRFQQAIIGFQSEGYSIPLLIRHLDSKHNIQCIYLNDHLIDIYENNKT